MPWGIISEHSGFFGAVLGAVAGGAGAWASISTWVKQLRENDKRQDMVLATHAKELEDIRISRKDLMYRSECDKEQTDCHRTLCKKLDEMSQSMRDINKQSMDNAKGIATIQEHLRGLEKRYDDDRQRTAYCEERHKSVL